MNSAHLDWSRCNFNSGHMTKIMKDGQSKEGSGRVGIHKATGLVHCYTLEVNFCKGRSLNTVSKATGHGAE